jgi:6-phosphogluconolactonase
MIVNRQLPRYRGNPQFDAIILGIGLDLHIASLFPSLLNDASQAVIALPSLLSAVQPYAVSYQPITRQARVTMTAPFILNNSPIFIPLLGKDKAALVSRLEDVNTPAGYILQKSKRASIFVGIT